MSPVRCLGLLIFIAILSAPILSAPPVRADTPDEARIPGSQVTLDSFDAPAGWFTSKSVTDGAAAAAHITGAGSPTHPADGIPASLKVQLDLPSAAGIRTAPDEKWNGLTAIHFSVYLPAAAPATLSLGAYVKDNEWWWYQAFPRRAADGRPRGPELVPGRWNSVTLDLRESAAGWTPGGHEKPWTAALRPFLEFGLVFYSKTPFHGSIEVGPITGWKTHDSQPDLHADSIEHSWTAATPQWKPVSISFHLNRHFSNPFDPDVVDVEGYFAGPMGEITFPGFYAQDYAIPPGQTQPVPRGDGLWKVRFTPTKPGKYAYNVTVQTKSGVVTLTSGSFICRAAHEPGYVRIDPNDERFFSFDDGSFYYPIGLNVRHAGDDKDVHQGLPAIEHYFDHMAAVGLNWTRTWMCSWWLALEWSHDYDARYHGVGVYNMANAWMLDKTMDIAAKDGLYVDLTLNNHGQFSSTSDSEWDQNPYNERNGGQLQSPEQFFTDPWARKMFQRRLRYIIARWGCDPHVFAWELFNEVDLTENYNPQVVSEWMSEMADYIHSIDPWQHLVSTHVCWWTGDRVLWSNPKLQFVQADAYVRWTHNQDTMATFTDKVWHQKERFDKPAYIVEFGYKPDPVPQFHSGIWAGLMSPFSADSMFWDWYVVDRENFWPQYAAIVRFARGEDRRGQHLKIADCSAESSAPLQAVGISNDNRAYVWVYHADREGSTDPSKFEPVSDGHLRVAGLSDGTYHVQFWDTFKGTIISETNVHSTGGQLMLDMPPIAIDVAAKIKKT